MNSQRKDFSCQVSTLANLTIYPLKFLSDKYKQDEAILSIIDWRYLDCISKGRFFFLVTQAIPSYRKYVLMCGIVSTNFSNYANICPFKKSFGILSKIFVNPLKLLFAWNHVRKKTIMLYINFSLFLDAKVWICTCVLNLHKDIGFGAPAIAMENLLICRVMLALFLLGRFQNFS